MVVDWFVSISEILTVHLQGEVIRQWPHANVSQLRKLGLKRNHKF